MRNVIYLNQRRRKDQPEPETPLEKTLRIMIGFCVVVGTTSLVYSCEETKAAERRVKYEACLKTGMKPINCSFEITFKETT